MASLSLLLGLLRYYFCPFYHVNACTTLYMWVHVRQIPDAVAFPISVCARDRVKRCLRPSSCRLTVDHLSGCVLSYWICTGALSCLNENTSPMLHEPPSAALRARGKPVLNHVTSKHDSELKEARAAVVIRATRRNHAVYAAEDAILDMRRPRVRRG